MLEEVLAPVPEHIIELFSDSPEGTIFHHLRIHREIEGIPDLNGLKIALVGVMDDRSSYQNKGCTGADEIRSYFYRLFHGSWHLEIADLGNIYKGERPEDTRAALREVCSELLLKGVIPVVLGGGQDLTYAVYRAFDKLEQTVNLVSVDSRFDLGKFESGLLSNTYLSHVILNKPYNLFNFANIGYQTYFVHQDELELMEKMNFEVHRLGSVKGMINEVEPVVRDADIVSIDNASIRMPDAPGNKMGSPNGFSGEEICAIARYSGISDKVSAFGLFEYNPETDINGLNAHLLAQVVWYFVEGVHLRKGDYPYSSKQEYLRFTVLSEDGSHEIIFYKSPLSERWWIEVPLEKENHARHAMIPCSHADYLRALEGEIPDRWWKAKQRGI